MYIINRCLFMFMMKEREREIERKKKYIEDIFRIKTIMVGNSTHLCC